MKDTLQARRKAIKSQALLEVALDVIEKALELTEELEAHAHHEISIEEKLGPSRTPYACPLFHQRP